MRGRVCNPALRALVIVLVLFQAILPSTIAMAQTVGVDLSKILCITPGTEPSEEAKQYAREMAQLLGEDVPEEAAGAGDCPLCTLPKGKLSAPAVGLAVPISVSAEIGFPDYTVRFVERRNGPPLGGRAPPTAI